jgi:hypothetical protein
MENTCLSKVAPAWRYGYVTLYRLKVGIEGVYDDAFTMFWAPY